MKLSIKNLKGEVFQVQVEPADSIEILKTKIQEAKGLPADSLKIVFKGKTVANEDTIEKLAIKETDFIVVMTQVQKPQPKPKEEVKPEPVKVETEKKEVPKAEEKKEAPKPNQPQPPAQDHEAEIQELMSMGFPRDQCEAALRAAFYNMQRAVEYIFNGIPSNAGNARVPEEAEEGVEATGPEQLRALFNHPQFANIRNLIRQNPAALQPLLAQLAQSAPPIYNLIAQYPQQFEQIIMEGDSQGSESQPAAQNQPQNPPPGTILISHADQQAINRLRQLGFSKLECAQAYFACDKNEEMAANLLFDRLANGDIEMEAQVPGGQGQGGPGSGQGGQGNANNEDDDDNLFN